MKKKTKTKRSTKKAEVVSFRIAEPHLQMLEAYAQGLESYDGNPLSIAKAAKKIILDFLRDREKKS